MISEKLYFIFIVLSNYSRSIQYFIRIRGIKCCNLDLDPMLDAAQKKYQEPEPLGKKIRSRSWLPSPENIIQIPKQKLDQHQKDSGVRLYIYINYNTDFFFFSFDIKAVLLFSKRAFY